MQSRNTMAERLSRKALYDLVWSEPMKNLATRFGVSDVALKKTCARAAVPTPDRGYWAKKEAGKETFQAALPPRPPGMDDEVWVGAGGNSRYGYWSQNELLGLIGPRPEFIEPIEAVRVRIAEEVGHVTVPRTVRNWHSAVDRLLKEDQARRERQAAAVYPTPWDNPIFDTPFERRRLRMLNSLFFAVARMNGRPSARGRQAREIGISFFQQHLNLSLDRPKRPRRTQLLNTMGETRDERLCLSILRGFGSEEILTSWQDDDTQKLESRMTDISVQVILTAEIRYREGALHQYEWRVQRKAELEEEERRRKIEAERAEKERQRRIEQGRINRLLRDAEAFQQAGAIRQYVEAIRSAQERNTNSVTEEFEQWRRWALAQAERIDPTIGGRFLTAMQDEEDPRYKPKIDAG
jgi:hypothetical protein